MVGLGCGDLGADLVVGRLPATTDAGFPTPVRRDAALPLDTGVVAPHDSGARRELDVDVAVVDADGVPTTARPGADLPLVVDIENLGRDASAPTRMLARLVPIATLAGEPPVVVGEVAAPPLLPLEVRDVELPGHVPSDIPPGRYHLEIEVDPARSLPDGRRDNNLRVVGKLDVGPLVIHPEPVDFGVVAPGCDRTLDVQVGLPDSAIEPVNVKQIGLQPSVSPFTLSPTSTPFTLDPGESRRVSIRFAPLLPGLAFARFEVDHDRFAGSRRTVVLGESESTPARREVLRQRSGPRLDLLLVVQSGCPVSPCDVADEQRQLADDGFGALRRGLAAEQADWRVLVTTSESRAGRVGQLRGAPIEPSTPGLEAEASRQLQPGASGSPTPGYVDAVEAVIEAGYPRSETGVVVVVLALHDEAVAALPAPPWRDRWATALGPEGDRRVHVNAILPPSPAGCPDGVGPTPGLESLVGASAGTVSSICDIDDFRALTDFGGPELGLAYAFPLEHEPIHPNTISVEVDGTFIDAVDYPRQRTRWRYDASDNAVHFEAGYVPRRGARVVIQYRSRC